MAYDTNVWEQEWKLEKASKADLISHAMQWEATRFSYELCGLFIQSFHRLKPLLNKNSVGKKVLDIGCGSGSQTLFFCAYNCDVTAIDVEKQSVETTKKTLKDSNYQAKVYQMNAEKLAFPDESFDIVYINCILMHVDKKAVISEAERVTKKGGLIIIKEVKKEWLCRFYRWFSPYRKTKPQYINKDEIYALEQLGYKRKDFYAKVFGNR